MAKVTLAQAVEARTWLTMRYARRLIEDRRIPYFKVGGRVLIDLDDLDRFVEAGRVEPASPVTSLDARRRHAS